MTRTNLLKSALLLLAGVVAACGNERITTPDASQVTFDVTVPASTPTTASVYVIGDQPNLGNGSNDAGLKLRRISDTKFGGAAYLPQGADVLYRVRLKDPSAAELDANGVAVDPHLIHVGTSDTTEAVTVAQWDVPTETVHPQITFIVTVPSNTPASDDVYLAGDQPEMGPWNPAFYKLTNNNNGTYSGTIQFAANPGTTIQYKAVRGDWAKVEKAADGSELANRTFTIPATNATVSITVARWADIAP